jgi:catechol 2,3-dioxygenase-like lactoylglutathione lyase family enzyme
LLFDHLDVTVSNIEISEAFYACALAPLGIVAIYRNSRNATGGQTIGFSRSSHPCFCIRSGEVPTAPLHVAFSARSVAEVDGFHAAALIAGARDNGKPGFRNYYTQGYYSAFIIDPDGHNVEAVFRGES